jgi:hypothetical protein
MADPPDLFARVPRWVFRPLPAHAARDETLEAEIDVLGAQLHDRSSYIASMHAALDRVAMFREYDSAVNRAAAHVWRALGRVYAEGTPHGREALARFAGRHLVGRARARVLRRLAKDPDLGVRRAVQREMELQLPDEVALPARRDGPWDATGWLQGNGPRPREDEAGARANRFTGDPGAEGPGGRHRQGRRVQEAHGLPVVGTVGELRQLLGIRSPAQLGYLLLACDGDDGPYTRFTVPKRDGTPREICAPGRPLRWYQRQILHLILDRVPPHPAAHGFVAGRSTVTNAAPHRGAAVLLKFDLTDFFPTLHYFRVMGLFASLGYPVGIGRFSTHDDAREVAPTLARLCTYTTDPRRFGDGIAPQGAPTSPALSNLVCRTLDARLDGLARRNGGAYTRYADDLTFSFPAGFDAIGRFRWWVDQVCHQEGFLVNSKKSHVIRRSQRQTVTGIVTNDALRVPRDQRRRFRAVLHNCRAHGVASQARGNPGFADYLRGFASYIHMVHPEEGAELLRQVDALLGPERDPGGEGVGAQP